MLRLRLTDLATFRTALPYWHNGIHSVPGLTAGAYEYQVIGRNSLGEGDPSDPVTVNVA